MLAKARRCWSFKNGKTGSLLSSLTPHYSARITSPLSTRKTVTIAQLSVQFGSTCWLPFLAHGLVTGLVAGLMAGVVGAVGVVREVASGTNRTTGKTTKSVIMTILAMLPQFNSP